MSANLTMTDLFCGAGGSSTGAVAVGGVDVKLAANHWDLAIETHNANHPDTDHLQADISNTDPRFIMSTDILWASPECTNHSRAKGRKLPTQPDLFGEVLPDAASERSRATMWDVVRFAEVHNYRAILVENVVEVTDWSSPNGTRGSQFRSWLSTLANMGYEHKIVSLNSMHAQAFGMPAPQSRDRVYIALWRTGERAPDFERMQRPVAWCPACGEVVNSVQQWKREGAVTGRYRSQYFYRCPKMSCRGQIVEPAWLPASSIIDWSIPGQRIGDRAKPLAEKTMRRIQMGIDRYWSPILTETANPYDSTDPKHRSFGDPNGYIRSWPLSIPTHAMVARESKALAYAPFMVPVEGRDGRQPWSAADAMRAQTTRSETGMALHPLLMSYYTRDDGTRPAWNPLATVTTEPRHALMVPAGGTWNDDARPTTEPFRTRTANEAEGVAMAPFMLERRHEYRTRSLEEAMSTVTANETTKALLFPPFIAELRGGGSNARALSEALATVTASGNHHALIQRMNSGGAEMTTPDSEPVRTVTTAGHQAVLTGRTVDIDDVRFRMLEPGEIKQAMAFPSDYEMRGNRREQVKLSGNAVTPPAARDLIATVVAAITGEGLAA